MNENIAFYIQAMQKDAITPIPNAKIQLESANLKQNAITDSNGMAYFEIEATQKLKSFQARLIHKDYQEIPILDRSIIPNALQDKTQQLRFHNEIYLLFNGEFLKIMKGSDMLMQIQAFSQATPNKQGLMQDNTTENFIASNYTPAKDFYTKSTKANNNIKSSDDANNTDLVFKNTKHCDNNNLQKENFVLENGEYYIKLDTLEQFYNKCETFHNPDTPILQNTENMRNVATDNINKKVSTNTSIPCLTFYRDIECKEKYAHIISHNSFTIALENIQKSIITSTNEVAKFANMINNQIKHNNQTKIKMQIQCHTNQTEKVENIIICNQDTDIESKKVIADIQKPFAPGTYVRLEAIGKNLDANPDIYSQIELKMWKDGKSESITKQYTLKKVSYFYLSEPQIIDNYKQQGYTGFQYIIYASSINIFDDTTPHIAFNINFEVGDGLDLDVRESKLPNNDTENKIYTLAQAVEFLRMSYSAFQKERDSKHINTILDYFTKYPRIAGKIAYIYYRFDLASEKFIESVAQDNGEYIRDRDRYIDEMVNLFDEKQTYFNNKTFSQKYKEIFPTYNPNNVLPDDNEMNERKRFIEYLVFKIIERLKLPYPNGFIVGKDKDKPYEGVVTITEKKPNDNGLKGGSYKDKIMWVNEVFLKYGNIDFSNASTHFEYKKYKDYKEVMKFERLINTIFHEVRHFYIDIHYKQSDKMLKGYIYFSNRFYLRDSDIFRYFSKICDNTDKRKVDCIQKQNIYEIQPNERDPRYVATQIVAKLKKKGIL